MRGRALLFTSLALNAGLVIVALLLARDRPAPAPGSSTPRLVRQSGTNPPRTHVVVRRQFFHWNELESNDYKTYITNLIEIGCPPDTIRDIIVADVNQLYERRRLTTIVPDDPVWWKGNPASAVAESITRQEAALDRERRALLTQLLGPGWEPSRQRPGAMVYLTGPVLSALPEETKLAVQDIVARFTEREREWREASKERPPTEAEVAAHQARLRQQTREELAKVLTPAQLEEYLLRWSFNAETLRRQSAGMELAADEFRVLFRATDAAQQQLQLLTGNDSATVARRAELAKQIDGALKQTLGGERFEQFTLSQDPTYTATVAVAAQLRLPEENIRPLYEITRETEAELRRIRSDAALTSAEQEAAIAELLKDQADTLRTLLGEEVYRKFKDAQEPPR
jgi:hypothetical protein